MIDRCLILKSGGRRIPTGRATLLVSFVLFFFFFFPCGFLSLFLTNPGLDSQTVGGEQGGLSQPESDVGQERGESKIQIEASQNVSKSGGRAYSEYAPARFTAPNPFN